MHELQITERILALVLRHAEDANAQRVVSVRLTIGELSDLESQWIQKYFDYLSRETIAHRAVLQIERSPAVLRCAACQKTFPVDARRLRDASCPRCQHERTEVVAGREYRVEDMKVV